MVYICGDTHGDFDKVAVIQERFDMTEDDKLIICGDFGFIWNPRNWREEIIKLEEIVQAEILFVDGNHENFDLIDELPVEPRYNSWVGRAGEHTYHLMRGRIYGIEGKKYFTFGGATSIDKKYRNEGTSWWAREEPTEEEYVAAETLLDAYGSDIDFVVTHEGPMKLVAQLSNNYIIQQGIMNDEVGRTQRLRFEKWYNMLVAGGNINFRWFFGHHHIDKWMRGNYALMDNVLRIDGEKIEWF